MSERFGDWFSYNNTPRARIFRSNQQTVQDKETMYNLMRSNNYGISNEGQVQGCNGSIPAAAIAARTDLQDENVECTWRQFDYMEGRKNYGALDVKIVDSSDIHHGSILAENGPTHSGGIEPFSWSDADIPDYSPVRTYNFSAVHVTWRDTDETLPIQPRSGSEPGATSYQFILLSILLVSLRYWAL
ncbi:putative phospholipase B-like 1 isoform X2 [Eurytemora carolleeae]|uniref:putative phospholipase B-like 1 isoform X2 n=1 Tax=Eurytemora carolleeae TaxID=1294199 RepID=UPI000C777C0F|nr:putative phospholipase B-like 1 isoform X2 [Eurytemora carolleeae]|eukprot:XP_023337284.1 putative phospholipase B-like 1 isoform X2 [Eurytemora affinis]